MAQITSLPDPTVNGLSGDVAISTARTLALNSYYEILNLSWKCYHLLLMLNKLLNIVLQNLLCLTHMNATYELFREHEVLHIALHYHTSTLISLGVICHHDLLKDTPCSQPHVYLI